MIRINLLPVRDVQKKERLRCQLIIAVLSLALVFVICGGLYAHILVKVNSEKASIAQTQKQIKQLKKVIGKVRNFKNLQKELQSKLDVLQKLKDSKSGPVHLLDELANAIPNKLWLTSFKEGSGKISISGVGLNEQTVAQFLQRMEASPYYQKVELAVTEQKVQKKLKIQNFKMTCSVENPRKKTKKSSK